MREMKRMREGREKEREKEREGEKEGERGGREKDRGCTKTGMEWKNSAVLMIE